MKKNTLILIAFIGIFGITSCKKFLDVKPKTELPQDVLFNTEEGFKDALTGVYIQMKTDNAYGAALTQTTIEQLISSWDVVNNSVEKNIGLFAYNDEAVEARMAGIYGQLYKNISSINAILGQIDIQKSVFKTPENFAMIKAECLGLRAYCHLDILRLFGPTPSNTAAGNMLPYVTILSKKPNPTISFDAYKTALLKDLTDAAALVKDIDPIKTYTIEQLGNPGGYIGGVPSNYNPSDTYFAYRYLRMNYYAIVALKARTNLYFGDDVAAYTNAKEVIDAQNTDGSPKFRLGISSDLTAGDYSFFNEQIFGLYDFEMNTKYAVRYTSGLLKKGTSATLINSNLFGNTGTDIRESSLWQLITLPNQAKCYVIKKYAGSASNIKWSQIPMLRVSEMYLIAAEVAPTAEAQGYWNTFKAARNITSTILPTDTDLRKMEVLKEFRKEFYAEGQAFFAYKRVNAPKTWITFIPSAAVVNYMPPIPKTEGF